MSNVCASSSQAADEQVVSLVVDGVSVSVPEGATILDAAQKAGISIPTLCFLKERSAISSCRICMVEVEGEDALVPACSTVAKEGMAITTASERLVTYRKLTMDLILSDHGLDSTNYCFSCKKKRFVRTAGGSSRGWCTAPLVWGFGKTQTGIRLEPPLFRSILIFVFAVSGVWVHATMRQATIHSVLQNAVCGLRSRLLLAPIGKQRDANRAGIVCRPVRRAPLP